MKNITISLLLYCAMISLVQAAAISINFSGTSGGRGRSTLDAQESTGVYRHSNWNNIVSSVNDNTSESTTNLKNDRGDATTTDISYKKNFWSLNNGNTANGTLSSGYINTPHQSNTVITLSQIDSEFTRDGYSIVVYVGGTDVQSLTSAIAVGANINGGASQWVRHLRSENGSVSKFHSQTFASEKLATASQSNSNYIIFTGLSADSVDINILKDANSRASVKGIQIVKNTNEISGALIGIGEITIGLSKIK